MGERETEREGRVEESRGEEQKEREGMGRR